MSGQNQCHGTSRCCRDHVMVLLTFSVFHLRYSNRLRYILLELCTRNLLSCQGDLPTVFLIHAVSNLLEGSLTTFARRHSRPQKPRSFWSAPRIRTSGPVQRYSVFEWLCKHNRLTSQPIRSVRPDSEHAQRDRKSVNPGLPVLDLARGRDSWC